MNARNEQQVAQDAGGGAANGALVGNPMHAPGGTTNKSPAGLTTARRMTVAELSQAPGSFMLTRTGIRGWKIFRFMCSTERVMFETLSNVEIHERLVAQWGAVGVIAALFGSIAYGGISTPPPGISTGFWTTF